MENSRVSSCEKICPSPHLRTHDVESPELLGQLSLIPEVCPILILSKSDAPILSTSQLKTRVATNSFAPNGHPDSPAPLLLIVCPSHIKSEFGRLALHIHVIATIVKCVCHICQFTNRTPKYIHTMFFFFIRHYALWSTYPGPGPSGYVL